MFDTNYGAANFGTPDSHRFEPLLTYVDQYRDGLLNAATLLGGCRGAGLVQTVIGGLADPAAPSRRVMHALLELRDLLTLEHVHNLDRDEAAHFAAISPADPRVEEICLLADGLCDAIDGHVHRNQRSAAA